MKKMGCIAVLWVLSLALVLPAYGQGDLNAYERFTEERNVQNRISLAETFLRSYPNSQFRPSMDLTLAELYVATERWAQILELAQNFELTLPSADNDSKKTIYTYAMVSASRLNSLERTIEFGDKVLVLDPANVDALMTLILNIPERLPADAAAREAALDKTAGLVRQLISLPKPAAVADDDWRRIQARAHASMGLVHLTRNQLAEAVGEYEQSIRNHPVDGIAQYRMGYALMSMMANALREVQVIQQDIQAAATDPTREAQVDLLVARRSVLEAEVIQRRDAAIDSFARAVALGGDAQALSEQFLPPLYQNKNGSLEGLELLVSQKRTELGL